MEKVVLITGGTSGIGKALAFEFGKQKFKIVFTGRSFEKVMEVEKMLQDAQIDACGVVADVTSLTDALISVNRAYKQYGRLDVLICNAGISMRALFESVDLEVIEAVMKTNFYGTVYYCKAALPLIKEFKGSIIGISSIAGYRGLPARTGYCASKFAMQGFLESLRTELLHSDVHVMVVNPGFTASNIRNTALNAKGLAQKESPLDEQKIMSSETVAQSVYKAYMQRKRDIMLTTQGKLTILLNKWLPWLMDRLIYNHFKNEKNSPLT